MLLEASDVSGKRILDDLPRPSSDTYVRDSPHKESMQQRAGRLSALSGALLMAAHLTGAV
jgi:hypothetical protein